MTQYLVQFADCSRMYWPLAIIRVIASACMGRLGIMAVAAIVGEPDRCHEHTLATITYHTQPEKLLLSRQKENADVAKKGYCYNDIHHLSHDSLLQNMKCVQPPLQQLGVYASTCDKTYAVVDICVMLIIIILRYNDCSVSHQ